MTLPSWGSTSKDGIGESHPKNGTILRVLYPGLVVPAHRVKEKGGEEVKDKVPKSFFLDESCLSVQSSFLVPVVFLP